MKIEELMEIWQKDCEIDKNDLEKESLKIPFLHGKYLSMLSTERIKFKMMTEKRRIKESELLDYYQGVIDGKSINREPWKLVESKSSSEKRVLNDKEIITLNIKIIESEECVLFLKEVLNHINQRNFSIKAAIDWNKLIKGSMI